MCTATDRWNGVSSSAPIQSRRAPAESATTSAIVRPPTRTASASGLSRAPPRSEEHTSELQSQSNLVCRLLLEKKKNFAVCSTLVGSEPCVMKLLAELFG